VKKEKQVSFSQSRGSSPGHHILKGILDIASNRHPETRTYSLPGNDAAALNLASLLILVSRWPPRGPRIHCPNPPGPTSRPLVQIQSADGRVDRFRHRRKAAGLISLRAMLTARAKRSRQGGGGADHFP
jgi:hypothetical protein